MAQDTATANLGRFVWHDMMTTDLAKSVEFYSELFGWTVQDEGNGSEGPVYHRISADGHEIGGFIELQDDVPSHWIGYVTVPDVAGAVEVAAANGGDVPVPAITHFDDSHTIVQRFEGGHGVFHGFWGTEFTVAWKVCSIATPSLDRSE